MKKIVCSFALAVLLLATAGCGAPAQTSASSPAPSESAPAPAGSSSAPVESSAPAEEAELIVSAAASLTDCMEEIKTLYVAEHAEITITYNFGSSGSLQQQIEQGAPADVFFSAGKKQMTALKDGSLMDDGSIRDILENKVVLVTPKGGAKLESFEALANAAMKKIAVGEPGSVPVGQYTEQVFKNIAIAEAVAPKLVNAKDVREVLSWVETGNVDAGIVYETDAKISEKVTICCTAPEGSHDKVIYPVGVVKDTKHAAQAQAFVDFLFTDAAKTVFEKYGFSALA